MVLKVMFVVFLKRGPHSEENQCSTIHEAEANPRQVQLLKVLDEVLLLLLALVLLFLLCLRLRAKQNALKVELLQCKDGESKELSKTPIVGSFLGDEAHHPTLWSCV